MNNFERGWVPMTVKKYLSDAQSPTTFKENGRMGNVPYALAVGSIIYAMTCTRPDVSYALSMTSRFHKDPGEEHWAILKNVIRTARLFSDNATHAGITKLDYIYTKLMTLKLDSLVRIILLLSPQ
ncbi:hypothetical protein Tco_1376832 [Tanacetum coccineum]